MGQRKVALWHFYQMGRKVCGLTHGDDFKVVGAGAHLTQTADHMQNNIKVQVAVIGLEAGHMLRVFNRCINWECVGISASPADTELFAVIVEGFGCRAQARTFACGHGSRRG